VLLQQARMIRRGGQEAMPEERDREDIEAQYRTIEQALEQRCAPGQHRCGCRWCLSSALQLLSPGRPAIAPV
jgi:hypothetical protein